MFNFRNILLTDRDAINRLFALSDFRAAEYSFANAFNWSLAYGIKIAFSDGFFVLRSGDDVKNYMFASGVNDVKTVVQTIINDASEIRQQYAIRAILQKQKQLIEEAFPDYFRFTLQRDSFDYIYLADDLTRLAGRKYQAKRNHITRFKKNYAWSYETITSANLWECTAMNEEWCRIYNRNDDISLKKETCAVRRALEHYAEEKLSGGLLRVDGEVIAYTVGEQLNSDTLIVHIEKAFSERFPGAYQVINQEFVQRHTTGLMYVNREDDAGNDGLRKAKLSYYPAFLLEKYIAEPVLHV